MLRGVVVDNSTRHVINFFLYVLRTQGNLHRGITPLLLLLQHSRQQVPWAGVRLWIEP